MWRSWFLTSQHRARAAAPPTADRWGRDGAVGAGSGCHADAGDARLASGASHVGTRGDGVGGGSTPPAVAPLVRAVLARGLCDGDGARAIVRASRGGRPVVWVRKRWKQDKDSLLVWRESGVGVGSLVFEPRCPLVRGHPQKMLVPLSSIVHRVKTVLSFRKSRVFSRTRFQCRESQCQLYQCINWGHPGLAVKGARPRIRPRPVRDNCTSS